MPVRRERKEARLKGRLQIDELIYHVPGRRAHWGRVSRVCSAMLDRAQTQHTRDYQPSLKFEMPVSATCTLRAAFCAVSPIMRAVGAA